MHTDSAGQTMGEGKQSEDEQLPVVSAAPVATTSPDNTASIVSAVPARAKEAPKAQSIVELKSESSNRAVSEAAEATEVRTPKPHAGAALGGGADATADGAARQAIGLAATKSATQHAKQEVPESTASAEASTRSSGPGPAKQECFHPQQSVEAAVSAAFDAADQDWKEAAFEDKGTGRASSLLSLLLSAVLRQLLPWVLPSALRGASAADVELSLSKKRLTLRGVSLQPQELTLVTGAPLQLLHCSIGLIQLRLRTCGESAYREFGGPSTCIGKKHLYQHPLSTCKAEGGPPSAKGEAPSKATATEAKATSKEGASSFVLAVRDVIVVLAPMSPAEWERRQLLELALRQRSSLLDSTDSDLQQQQQMQQQQQRWGLSFGASALISSWIDRNIEWASLELSNFHLRLECVIPPYDSRITSRSSALALGVVLQELHLRTIPPELSMQDPTELPGGERQQQQQFDDNTKAWAAAPPCTTKNMSQGCSSSATQAGMCSRFDIKGLAMYVHDELLLLGPHTRSEAETVQQLRAIAAEQKNPGIDIFTKCSGSNGGGGGTHIGMACTDNGNSGVELLAASSAVASQVRPGTISTAYSASVECGCVEATFCPAAAHGLRWLAVSFEEHRKAVETAEAVLSLVRPFVPSCTVRGNSGIWWRFAIRAVRRLLRSSRSNSRRNDTASLEGPFSVEETLKMRLIAEKSATYRLLRLLQLQGKASQQQEEQLLVLRDSIPLHQLLHAHGAARQDFIQQQAAAAAAATKGWTTWLPVWRRTPPQGVTAAMATAGTVSQSGCEGSSRPPLPPLALQKVLDQRRSLRQSQRQVEEQESSPLDTNSFADLDDFYDACSQPATARFDKGVSGGLPSSLAEDPAATLLLEDAKKILQAKGTRETEEERQAPSLTSPTSGDGRSSALETELPQRTEGTAAALARASEALTAMDDQKSGCNESVESAQGYNEEEDASFEECLDPETSRMLSMTKEEQEYAPNVASGTAAPVRSAYTLSVSVMLRYAAVACCMDKKRGLEAEVELPQQEQLRRLQEPAVPHPAEQRLHSGILLCSVSLLSVSGIVGTEGIEGSALVGHLGFSHRPEGLQPEQQLVYKDPRAGAEPLLRVCISRSPDYTEREGSVKELVENSESNSNILSLTVRRVICFLSPDALKDASALGKAFGTASAAAASAAAEASQKCTLLHLRGSTCQGEQDRIDPEGGVCGLTEPKRRMNLHQRLLILSPKRQQQLRDTATLRYSVSVEAPTLIAPASDGRAVLCHLGELRICSARYTKGKLSNSSSATGRVASPGLKFADSIVEEQYYHTFKESLVGLHAARAGVRPTSGTVPSDGAAVHTERVRHISLRTFHGVLLRDSHILIHPNHQQLKGELESLQPVDHWGFIYTNDDLSKLTERKENLNTSSDCRAESGYQHQLPEALLGHQGPRADSGFDCSATDYTKLPSAWNVSGKTQPVLFPSELVATIEIEHSEVCHPAELWLPLRLPVRSEDRHLHLPATVLPNASAGSKCSQVKETADEQTALTGSDVFTHPEKTIDRTQGSSRSLASPKNSSAILCHRPVNPHNNYQGGSGSLGVNNSIPMYVSATLAWEKMAVYLHSLDRTSVGDITGKAWPLEGSEHTDREIDALQLQATGICVYINSNECRSVGQLDMQQLLLEQPCLPKDSLNRYILCLPSPGTFSEAETAGAASESECLGKPSIGLEFCSSHHSIEAAEVASVSASVRLLKHMTLNFRPTPLTWLLNFVKDPAMHTDATDNDSAGSSGGSNIKSTTSSLTEFHETRTESTAQPHEFDLDTVAPITACSSVRSSPQASAPTRAVAVDHGAAARAFTDPLLRDLKLELQSVDFLWTTRGTDLQLATATLSAALVRLRLNRFSTKFAANVKDFSLNFVVPAYSKATAPLSSNQRTKRTPCSGDQLLQTVFEPPVEDSKRRTAHLEALHRRPVLMTTEIIGLVPGNSCAISSSLESVHPLSPRFSGLTSSLKVEVGTCRVVYIHPKFWRLFDWMIDDFVGTLTFSSHPSPTPREEDNAGKSGRCNGSRTLEETPLRPIQRSPSLEDLAINSARVLQSSRREEVVSSAAEGETDGGSTDEDMKNIGEDKKLWSVPNEGLRRIFLLADAGRKILGLPELLLQTQPSGTCKNNLEGLVLPKAVPFSSFHYEVRITSPRLLLPASCIPSCRGVVCWPPLTCSRDKDASGDSKFSNHGCSRETCRTCGVVGKSQAAGGANEREIECFLDNFTVSNSWSLSHRYGLVEAINVSFKGLRAFARVDSHFQVFSGSDSGIVQTPEQHEKQGATSTRSNAVCCCCTHPALSSSRFLRRNAARLLCPTTTTPDSADIQCQLDASSSPGRYLLGSVDLVVHMYRPALLRPASSWLRVEVGLLPLRLDIQTLSLLFDVIKNNVTANDPEVEATRLHSLSPAAKAVPQNKEVPGIKFDVLPAEAPFAPVSPRDIQQSPNVVPGSQLKASAVKPRDDSDVCAILQELQDHQTLQGLLEPQLDFIELLEEWGHETFLLELVAHGLHLAVCEAQLEKQITLLKARCSTFRRRIGELLRTQEPLRRSRETSMASDCSSSNKLTSRVSKCPAQQAQQNPFLLFHATRLRVQLRSLRLQRMEAEQVGLLLPAVVVANDWVPLSSKNEEVQTTQVVYTQTRIIPPVTGTFIGMRVGSSTLFCPEFASPFCVVFTDSSCPLGLLQQQLEPLVNSTRHAEADAIAAAVAAARGDYSLATLVNPEQQSARRVSDEHDLQHTHQEEHPLVTAFTVPWVDPLQLRDLKEDLTSEESGLVSPAVAHSATTALLGDTVLGTPRKLDTSARSSDFKRAASGEPVGLPEISRDYTVIFDSADSCSRVQQHPAQGKLPSVLPAVALSPHPEELKVFYKSASAIPVIPLSESSLLTIREQQNMPSEAKLQILQRLSHQRKHQRRQQRVSVSSWRPRCVLSLPLLTRIGAFFSHKEVQPSGMPSQTPSRSREAVYEDIAYSNSFTAVEDPRKINQSVKAATDHPFPAAPVADQEAAGGSCLPLLGQEISCKTAGVNQWHSMHSSSSDNRDSSRRTRLSRSTDDITLRSSADPYALGIAVPQAFSIDEDLTCFGSKALAVCRSSFDSAKRFAAELRSRGRRMPLGKLQPRHAATDEEGWSSSDDSWERSSEGNRHYTNCQQLSSDSTSGLSTGPQKLECPPLQLSSLNAALHLSEASVLVPVDSRISSTSSVLLRGSVDLSRRADGVHDPMDPSETSEDAEIACTLYRQLRGCDSSGSGGTSWGCNIDSVLFTAPDNTGHPLQEQNSRGRDRINYLGRLEDRFSPGLRAVDFLLQHAAVTCLRNSSPLQQLDASTADLHRRRKLLERRYIRSLRRSGTRGGGGNSTAPLGATQGANFADEGLPHFLPNELRSSAALGQVAFFKSCEDPSTGQQAIPAAVSASASERSWGSFGMPQADKEPNISVEAPSFTSAVDEPGSIAEDSQNSVRAICSDLWAQLTCFVLPPADPCGWKAKILNDAAMGVSQGVASDSRSCADAQGSCCRCLIRDKNFSRAGARRTPPGQRCNCCCHHPQEYTAVHVGPCELEVSYQDCLLICRCAAEQTRQLEEQQQLQQMHERVLQRLLRRCTMLQRELLLRQRRWQQPSAGEWENQQPCSVQKTSFGDRTPRSTAEMEQLRLSLPRVKERTLTPNKYAVRAPKGLQPYPPQRHLFAGLPLVRVTLLNDHLDCLQAPLLQLLLTDCRLTRAFYVLPPPHAALRQQEKQQRCAVSIFESSLRLWALNPLAVAFEPVVESLPLSLVVREAPYSLMHWAYSTRCDDASSSLTLDWQGNSTRLQKNRPSCPQQHQHRHDPRFSRIVVPSKTKPPSSESINNSSRQSSKDEASSSSVAPVLFRFSKTAADQETYAFEHQQEHSARRDVPSLEHLSVKLLRQHQSPGKTESSSGSIQQQRTLLSPPQGLRAKKMDRIGDDTATQVTEAVAHGEQYMGISLSCPEGSAIEANLSPLLLQSVLGSLYKWHCDFAQHMQQQQAPASQDCQENTAAASHGQKNEPTPQQNQSAAEHDDEHEAGPAFLSEQRQTLVNDRRGAPLRKPPSSSTEALLAAFTLRGSCMEKRHISDDNGHLDTETLYKSGLASESDGKGRKRELRPLEEAARPKRGRLFIPYQIVNQTGLQLGVLLLPPSKPILTLDSKGFPPGDSGQAVSASTCGLPSNLRVCQRHNKTKRIGEEYSSSEGSSTSEAEIQRDLAASSIFWDFGPALQRLPCGSTVEPGVDGPEGSSKMTVSCPPSPARSKDFDPATHPLHSLGRPEQWDWLRPLEERALTQMRLSTGAVATVHVALQLADQVPGTYDPQYSMCDTAADEQMRQGGSGRLIEGAVGHCRRWRLRMPVPLDRVGVYIQPLTDTKTVPSTGSTTASLGVHKDVAPFVVCRLIADGGTKQLLVQSQVVLRNSCSLPLEVMLLHPQEAPSLGPQENKPRHTEVGNDSQLRLLLLKPGETTAVPVDLCFTGRLRVRPIQAGLTYSWSRDLSLGMLWQVVNEAQQHGVSGTGKDAFKRSLPKLDLLRCCPLQSNTGNCNKCEEICSPATAEQGLARELVQENLDKQRQCDYHMAVLYGIERLLHSSISCLQLKVSFEAPLRLASNIPFPVRYRVHCPLVLKAGQDPPDDSEGSLQLNNCQYVHSFPLAGVAFLSLSLAEDRWSSRIQIHPRPLQRLRPPAAAPTAAADGASGSLSTATGRRHSSADLVKLDESKCRNGGAAEEMPGGETIVEVECSDTSYRVSKLWIIFCETEGGIPCLLLHAPVWMVSYVPWSLQKQMQQQRQHQRHDEGRLRSPKGHTKRLSAVEYSALHRDSLTEAGWAMQAVSAAAAAVDLNRSLESRKPVPVPKFGISTLDGLANHFDGEIRLLDFNLLATIVCCSLQTSSIRVEAEGLGCSSFLDIWGDFPKNLQVSSRFSTAHDTLMSPRQAMQIPGGLSANFPSSSSKEACAGQSATDASYKGSQVSGNSKKGFLHGSVGGNPSLDLVATRMEAGIPLLRPVLLLTLAPMYTVTNHCSFPVRVRQARAGLYCSYEGATSKAVDFTLELEPQQTQPLVWQFAEGSRAIQAQGLMPTLCWLQHGCSRVFLDPRTDGAPETVWSAWSGYSPLCFPREEWCLRLPFAPVEFPLDVHKMHEDCSCSTIRGKASPVSYEDPAKFMGSRLQPHELQPLSSISAAEPYRQLSVLLRRGVSVESSTKSIHNHRRIPDQLDARLYASSGCSLRLETEEGPANSISLIIKEEDFKLRDAISISNDTPLPLLVRQCCHKSTPENDTCGAASSGSSSVVEKFALPEAATLGVDSVTTAVVELWGAAIQGNSTQQNFNRHDTDNSGQHVKSDLGNHGEQSDRSMHLLNMLLEAQQRAEQERTHHQKGVALSHSPTSVYISPAPQKEAIQLQLNRLSRLAEAIVAENAAEHDKKQAECMGSGPSNAGSCSRCTWCRFESAVAKELRRIEASNGTPSGDADSGPSMLWPLPQLVLPGETVLFAWDDYRNLPCIELSYFSRLQQSLMEDSSPTAKLASSSHSASVSSTVDLHYLDQPFVACIPLHSNARGVIPLSPLPSSCWFLFRVVHSAGRLRLQIAPAGEVLGVGVSHPPGGDIARQREGTISKHVSPPHSSREVPPPAAGTASGGRISSWAEDDTEQVHVSSEDVDIDSLLTLPRYFLLSVVHKELAMDCSSGCSSGMHGHVRPWAFASMCPFAAAVVGSYAPDRKSASVAPATVHSGSGQSESADSILPLRPIPEPPKFELRMKIPLLQLSVLSQAAITDPLSRQIDSMHSQAYYPVLLQRAPSMPSEAPAVTSSSLQVPLASESSDNQVQGSGGRRAVSQHAISPEQGNSQGALVDFMMQQRQPHNSTDEGDVVLVDKCILSLKPISIKTDLNSFYVASEALNCWRSAFAAATASVNLLDYAGSEGSPMASPTTLGGEQPKDIPDTSPTCCESACSTDSRSGPPEAKGMEYHYSMQSGLEWACKGSSHWHSPVLFFVSKPADANLGFAPSPMFLRPRLVRRSAPASKEDRRQQLKHQRRQLYIFRVLVIAETCVVLSFKADTGGNSSALRRSVVTLSSLEDARLQINGLHMTAQSLTEKLKDFQQQQQPQFHCSFPLLLQLQHCHRRPALSLRDIARVVGQFYQQQLFSHLSKVLVSVDVLGNPALSFAHLQAGVYALARQPLEAAEAGGDVFEGMIKGAEDFLKHTGYGFFGGISRMAGVASDSLGALACDEVYVHARKQQGRHKARNVEEGLQQGVEALGRALAGGFTGLVEEPVRGAAEGGLEGLLRGAGRGIAGFLVKPLTGVLDLAQKTAEAIKDASQIEGYQRPRRRLPRLLLGASRLLVAYDAEAAAAKAILTEAEGQNWSNLPVLYFALDRSLESLTVLTESHMLLFKVHARCPAELQFLAPLSCILAAGHCSMQSRSSKNTKNLKVSGSLTRERHVVVLQILRSGESGVCYQQLLYANERLQRHILQSLRQLMLQ
ncbi:uncharacterized protein LOC34621999 [Cyclospora cayetanensis]|uniref:Uncharacterized protein LOC34621999 n=1 Tax=Cyclospora cayetanensis TaxID=88456 RepID=A0A6P6RV12_9EIME|nr:uncharacterized protein LOC34621999 [Cyclospora cayetanensis]